MKIYHYSFTKEILESGLDSYIKQAATTEINELIYEIYGDYFGRDVCVFFNFNREDDGEITVSVDTDTLDVDCLYVADQNIANIIYDNWYKGKDCTSYVQEYVSSIVKFSDYKGQYNHSEIFYTNDIPKELLKVEYICE